MKKFKYIYIFVCLNIFCIYNAKAQTTDYNPFAHKLGSKYISAEGGVVKNGFYTSLVFTQISSKKRFFDTSFAFSFDHKEEPHSSQFSNLFLSFYLQKAVLVNSSKKVCVNAGLGAYLGFEFLSNEYLNRNDQNYLVPGISAKVEPELLVNKKKGWWIFVSGQQVFRYKSDIGNSFYSLSAGVKVTL